MYYLVMGSNPTLIILIALIGLFNFIFPDNDDDDDDVDDDDDDDS